MSAATRVIRPFVFISAALVVAFSAATVAPAAQAQEPLEPHQAQVMVKDYDVFVDLPTAFAYIKLPTGWKFIGKLDAAQLRRLPEGTLTSLLPAEQMKASVMVAKAATRPVR